jgi:hypothetical protein
VVVPAPNGARRLPALAVVRRLAVVMRVARLPATTTV